MIHKKCDWCGRSVKEVGRVMRKGGLLLCKECRKKYEKNRKLRRLTKNSRNQRYKTVS